MAICLLLYCFNHLILQWFQLSAHAQIHNVASYAGSSRCKIIKQYNEIHLVKWRLLLLLPDTSFTNSRTTKNADQRFRATLNLPIEGTLGSKNCEEVGRVVNRRYNSSKYIINNALLPDRRSNNKGPFLFSFFRRKEKNRNDKALWFRVLPASRPTVPSCA